MIKNSIYKNEEELFEHLRNGDERSLNWLFQLLYSRLCSFTTQFTKDEDIAEELTIDAFHKLWERRTECTSLQAIKGFLYLCTRNAALNYLDKQRRQSRRMLDFFGTSETAEEPILAHIIYTEVWEEIKKEIDCLPEQCAKIIKLLYEMDLTPDEVAQQLNISRNTVYSQKFRGLAILKKKLSSTQMVILLSVFFYK